MPTQQQKIFKKFKKKIQTLGKKYTYFNNVLNSKLYLHYKNIHQNNKTTKIKITKNKIK